MTAYDLTYKGVHCSGVDWESLFFVFQFGNMTVYYHQPSDIDSSADTDHIRMCIDLFLHELVQGILCSLTETQFR